MPGILTVKVLAVLALLRTQGLMDHRNIPTINST